MPPLIGSQSSVIDASALLADLFGEAGGERLPELAAWSGLALPGLRVAVLER